MSNTILLSVVDAKAHLNTSSVSSKLTDAEIQVMCNAAARLIEGRVGPIDAATHTVTIHGNATDTIVLGHTRINAITALTLVRDGTSPVNVAELVPDPTTGVVRSRYQVFPAEPFVVTYTVGPRDLAGYDNLVMACKIIVQSLAQTNRGPRSPGQGGGDIPTGAMIPARAEALLGVDDSSDGFA